MNPIAKTFACPLIAVAALERVTSESAEGESVKTTTTVLLLLYPAAVTKS